MPSTNDYYRSYRQAERDMKNGNREDLIDDKYGIVFNSKQIKLSQFIKFYKDKIINKEQEHIFNSCLDLLDLINASKECLKKEGAYTKNATGTLKVNPAQKELRENIKSFSAQLRLLHLLIGKNPPAETLEEWLDD